MPDMDGASASKLIREYTQSPTHPYILALTADVQSVTKSFCFECGMNNFLGKPFTGPALVEAIRMASPLPPFV